MLDAEMACPLCGAEYAVAQGEAWFNGKPAAVIEPAPRSKEVLAPDVERLAAQLGVMGGMAPVLLAGRYGAVAADYAALTGAPVVVITESPVVLAMAHPGVSVLHIGPRVPLGAGTLAAAAFDAMPTDATTLMASVARAVRGRGRLLAPVEHVVPAALIGSLRELARDETEWVAELTAASSGLVALRRSPPPV